MARVLLLTLVFPPDSVSTAQIMGELGKDLQTFGHQVVALTTTPHYNRDSEAEVRQPLRPFWGRLLQTSDFGGLRAYHVWMPKKGSSVLLRMVAWLGFHLVSTLAGVFVVPRPDIIICPSPPLTIGVSAWLLGLLHRAPYVYNVQEIYPDIAINLGVLRNPWLIRALRWLERFVYARAADITVIAPRMRRRLLDKGVPAHKVHFVPNFVDVEDLQPHPKDNGFSRRHGLDAKFVVSYAGNLGPAQGLESFIQAAHQLRAMASVHFLMLGDGILRETLRLQVEALALPNLLFLPYQPYSLMPQIYSASDLCLVSLALDTASDAIPSKVYRIMACARPVLAVVDGDSDLAHLVTEVGCGEVVRPGSAENLAEAILRAYGDQERQRRMGQAGRAHVVEHYARGVVTAQYHQLIERVATACQRLVHEQP